MTIPSLETIFKIRADKEQEARNYRVNQIVNDLIAYGTTRYPLHFISTEQLQAFRNEKYVVEADDNYFTIYLPGCE